MNFSDKINLVLRDIRLPEGQIFVIKELGDHGKDPFLLLVSIILSQNTNDKNSAEALKRLLNSGLITPEKVINASRSELIRLIKPAGLHNQKAKVIQQVAWESRKGELFADICKIEPNKAEQTLMKIKGIGKKTAHLFLSIYCGQNFFAVDRHISRVTQRILGKRMNYEEISNFWIETLTKENRNDAHFKLIYIGRVFCRPRNPRCLDCPFKSFCKTSNPN